MHLEFQTIKRGLLAATTAVNVPLSLEAPDNAVQAPGNFMGFGFETAFINDYANSFTVNLLNSVAKRLDTVPIIRIGGTSGDRVTFDESQQQVKVCIQGDCPIGSSASYILGPSYFDGFKYLSDFGFTFQAPLGPVLNISNTAIYVSRAYEQVNKNNLAAVAIGNEPNLYSHQYNINYTLDQYVNGSKTIMDLVSKTLGFNDRVPMFEVLDLSSTKAQFNLIETFEDNLDSSKDAKIAAWHWYQLPGDYNTLAQQQEYLMNHTAIVLQFDPLKPQLEYLKQNNPTVQPVLSETGSGTQSSIEILSGFGAALWCIDFQLYSLTQGISRVDASHRPAALHSYWVPDNSAGTLNPGPQVRGVWYALPFIADFLGPNPGKVIEVDMGSDTLVAYAIYDASTSAVSKLALINLRAWAIGDGSSRGSETVSVPVSFGISSVNVKRLQSAAGAQAMGFDYAGPSENITWAGEQWSYFIDRGNGHQVAGVAAEVSHPVSDGKVQIQIQDSEALSIEFWDSNLFGESPMPAGSQAFHPVSRSSFISFSTINTERGRLVLS